MKNENGKSAVKKYYFEFAILMVVYFAALLACAFFIEPFLLKIVLMLACIAFEKFASSYLGVKNFMSILIVEKNAVKFAEALEPSKYFSPSALYRALAAYYSGDMQQTVNVCGKALKSNCQSKPRCFYASMMAKAYFELGDDRKLCALITYFKTTADLSGKAEAVRKAYGFMDFFEAYLAKDLGTCEKALKACAESEKRTYANLAAPQMKFFFAVASYRLGDSAAAKRLFEEVICEAPKTHFSRSAHKHLDAIAMETPEILECAEILPDESFEIYGKKMRRYMKIRKVLFAVAFLLVVIGIAMVVLI